VGAFLLAVASAFAEDPAPPYQLAAAGGQVYVGQEILFTLTLGGVNPADVYVIMPGLPEGTAMLALRKFPAPDAAGGMGCRIEAVAVTNRAGYVSLPQLAVNIGAEPPFFVPFQSVYVRERPRDVLPRAVLAVEGGTAATRVGQALTLLLRGTNVGEDPELTWDLPQDAAFALAPADGGAASGEALARFAWTPLQAGTLATPAIRVRTVTPAGEPFIALTAPLRIRVDSAPVENAAPAGDPGDDGTVIMEETSHGEARDNGEARFAAREYAALLAAERSSWPWSAAKTTRRAFESARGLSAGSPTGSLPLCVLLGALFLRAAAAALAARGKPRLLAGALCAAALFCAATVRGIVAVLPPEQVYAGGPVRVIPEEKASTVATLPPCTRVAVLRGTASWVRIRHAAITGWVPREDMAY
jgi:hypothetical protein